jgi:hypothetical protein
MKKAPPTEVTISFDGEEAFAFFMALELTEAVLAKLAENLGADPETAKTFRAAHRVTTNMLKSLEWLKEMRHGAGNSA